MCLIMLAVLFCSRWLFCSLGLGFLPDPLCFSAESLFFILLFGLGLYGVPSPIPELCLLLGAAGLGALYSFQSKSMPSDMLRLFSVLPVFLWFAERCNVRLQKPAGVPFWIRTGLAVSAVAGLPFAINRLHLRYDFPRLSPRAGMFSVVWLFPVLLGCAVILYAAIRRRTPKTAEPFSRLQSLRTILWAALSVVSVAENAVYLYMFEDKQALDILPLLWISCWILLYAQGDPLLIPVAARCRRRAARFLKNPENA